MGSALALGLRAQDHSVTVWNRTAAKAEPLLAHGCRLARSLEDAIADADVVIGNVSDYASSAALFLAPPVRQALRGKLFVQLATGTPRQAREAAAWAAENEIAYLDGAIEATPDFIGQAGCTILYSGAKPAFDAHQPVFAALGGNALYVGADIGHANALDAAILTVFWAFLFGAWHAAAICEAERFPLDVLASSLTATMPVLDGALQDSLQRIAGRRFAADASTMASVETCYASVRLIHEISKEHGLHLGLTNALETVSARARGAGRGADDLASVFQSLRD
jgi:3-hydroxyisobutyrate dehydrogenase-like beta-hydroxyacid dehydrogenase